MTNNHVTKQQKVRERIKEEIKKDMKNETVIQSLWNVAKAILRGKFTATQTYHKKKKLQINNLTLHINELEKTQSQQKERNNKNQGRNKGNKDFKKQIEKITETKICFFEKIGKFDKPIARLINKKDQAQIKKIK